MMKNRVKALEALVEALDGYTGARPEAGAEEGLEGVEGIESAESEESEALNPMSEGMEGEEAPPVEVAESEESEEESSEDPRGAPIGEKVDVKKIMEKLGRRPAKTSVLELGVMGAAPKSKK